MHTTKYKLKFIEYFLILTLSSSIKYADFEFEGKKVFEGMDPHDIEMTFMKKKFFQNFLKHIKTM